MSTRTCPLCDAAIPADAYYCRHCRQNLPRDAETAAVWRTRGAWLCLTCGTVATPRSYTPGNVLLEIVLWLAFLLPGLLYSLWRLSARCKVCGACGAKTIVPSDSPRAREAQVGAR